MGLGQKKNAFSELINSLSFAKFLPAFPHHVVSRDYLSVKLWDVRFPKGPLASIAVCDYLEKKMVGPGKAFKDAAEWRAHYVKVQSSMEN